MFFCGVGAPGFAGKPKSACFPNKSLARPPAHVLGPSPSARLDQGLPNWFCLFLLNKPNFCSWLSLLQSQQFKGQSSHSDRGHGYTHLFCLDKIPERLREGLGKIMDKSEHLL